jgi:16S rRNA G966 N2-methylase RsmD
MNIDNDANQIRAKLYDRLQKELVKFIFADVPYSDEKLTAELKKMEAEYNIWLSE